MEQLPPLRRKRSTRLCQCGSFLNKEKEMLVANTYQVVQKQCNQPLRETVASLVGDEGLPFVRDEGRAGWRIILAEDRKQYEAAGWKVQGIAADEARQRPMLKVSPPPKKPAKPDFFDDSQSHSEFG